MSNISTEELYQRWEEYPVFIVLTPKIMKAERTGIGFLEHTDRVPVVQIWHIDAVVHNANQKQ